MSAPDYAAKIAGLEAAVASGELTVETGDERVTYRSMSELMTALGYFRSQQALAANMPRSATTLAAFEAD